jgi:ABC-type transport system involved in cytochrome c biogenesis permease subunit
MESILFFVGLGFMFLAFAASLFSSNRRIVSALGICALAACLSSAALRTALSGRLPFASMYEFGLLLSLALYGFFVFLSFRYADRIVPAAAAFCAFALGSVMVFFFDKARPLAPALKSAWLGAHVLTAVVAYGCLAMSAAFAIAALVLIRQSERSAALEALVGRLVFIAFPFLTLLIITGAIWAEYAWGSFWRWDPKETWALVTWLVYLAYLHLTRTRGWKGKRAMIAAILGFSVVLFTFFGVNLLLAGLHSYV